ncbi:TAXI family TRAP transporter solute-binding subunit [Falsiroseomonas sp. E2-1-a20]|uniref:TAXI family TRAP transporter solute-binding subunit n=1 Tax=Falsiroseomonas sp. E2-1-a20 TaxID=3239300 RepID=UPI003F3E7919
MHRRNFVRLATAAPLGLSTMAGLPSPALAQTRFVRIATAGSGGNYYRLGSGLAAIWNDTVAGVRASIQATGGTVQNLDLLADREVEVAYLAGSIGELAYKNEGVFANRPRGRYQGLRSLATVYPNPQWFLAMNWAPEIKTLRDLKGKRVSVGMQGSQGEAWWRIMMGHMGWTYRDIRAEFTVHGATIDQVRNRQIDAVVWPDAPGSSSVQQMMDTGFARIIDIDEDVIAFMAAQGLDYPYTVEARHVPGSDRPFRTFAAPTTLAVHDRVSDDLAHALVKTMFENKPRLLQVHPLADFMTLANARDGLPFPLHPGAERFYQESSRT